jgi:hypothetical protein
MNRTILVSVLLALTAGTASAGDWEFEQVALAPWAVQTWQRQHPELGAVICYAGADHNLGIAWHDSIWNCQDISLPSSENKSIHSVDIAPDGRIGAAFGADSDWSYAERTLDSAWRISDLPVPEWRRGGAEAAFDEYCRPQVVYAGSIHDSVGLVLHFTRTDSGWSVDTVARHSAGIGSNSCGLFRLVVRDSERMAVLYSFFWTLLHDTPLFYSLTLYLATLDDSGQWRSSSVQYAYNGFFPAYDLTYGPEDTARFCYYVWDGSLREFYYGDQVVDTVYRVETSLAVDDLGRPLIAHRRTGMPNQPLALMFRDTDWHTVYPGVDSPVGLDLTLDPDGNPLVSYAKDGFVWLTRGVDVLGITELPRPALTSALRFPTIIRGNLVLPRDIGAGHNPILPGVLRSAQFLSGLCLKPAQLLDATGRKVMDLQPGENDVRHLAPGVYFIRSEPSAVNRQPRAALVRKVVIQR